MVLYQQGGTVMMIHQSHKEAWGSMSGRLLAVLKGRKKRAHQKNNVGSGYVLSNFGNSMGLIFSSVMRPILAFWEFSVALIYFNCFGICLFHACTVYFNCFGVCLFHACTGGCQRWRWREGVGGVCMHENGTICPCSLLFPILWSILHWNRMFVFWM